MMKIEFKRRRSNKWELIARHEASSNAKFAETIDGFVWGFNYSLTQYKRDSVGMISGAYKAVKIDSDTAHVMYVGHVKDDGKDILIAVVTNKQ